MKYIAIDLGLEKEFAYREKIAAQYGSKFDKGILRLAKNENIKKDQENKDNHDTKK